MNPLKRPFTYALISLGIAITPLFLWGIGLLFDSLLGCHLSEAGGSNCAEIITNILYPLLMSPLLLMISIPLFGGISGIFCIGGIFQRIRKKLRKKSS